MLPVGAFSWGSMGVVGAARWTSGRHPHTLVATTSTKYKNMGVGSLRFISCSIIVFPYYNLNS